MPTVQHDFFTITEIFTSIASVFVFVFVSYLEPFVGPYIPLVKVISLILSILFFIGIIFSVLKLRDARIKEYEYHKPTDIEKNEESAKNIKWETILKHLDSENPTEWRIAILEADNMLEGALQKNGFGGDSIGESLRGMTKKDLNSIQDAWEAHKVRNLIAHEGLSFVLTKRKAQQTINSYNKVFSELGYL